jgi:hypothetical protein
MPIDGPARKIRGVWKKPCGRCERNVARGDLLFESAEHGMVCAKCRHELAAEAKGKDKKKKSTKKADK